MLAEASRFIGKMMRRSERKITDISAIKKFLDGGLYCDLALVDGNKPYCVPLCYAYKWNDDEKLPTFYMHCAKEGRKLDIIRQNPNSCLTIAKSHGAVYTKGMPVCTATMHFDSVIAEGKTEIVESGEEHSEALSEILEHFGIKRGKFTEKALRATRILKFTPVDLSMKSNGMKH